MLRNKNFVIDLLKRGKNFYNKQVKMNFFYKKVNSNFKNITKISFKAASIYKIVNCKIISSSCLYFDENNKIIRESIDHYARDHEILTTKKTISIKGNVLNMCNINHMNYYHFIIDMLYKLYVFKSLGLSNYKLIFLKKNFTSYRKEILLFFFPEEVKNLYFVDNRTTILCENAYHINSNFEYNFSKYRYFVSFLNKKISSSKKIKKTNKKLKVFVSRKLAKYRNFVNEKKLITFLKKRGFRIFYFEKENVINQFNIFKNSKIILTCHGSALTNLIACDKKTKIIEIHSEFMTDNYSKLAKILSIKNYFNYLMRRDDPFLHFYENMFIKNKNKLITKENLDDLETLINFK